MTSNNNKLPSLYLPALLCQMGNWKYFATCMKLGDVVERIKVAKELRNPDRYDKWIQREIDPTREEKISNYLLNQPERFFSSLVVTVYGGKPRWLDLGMLDTNKLTLEDFTPLNLESIDRALGLLLLSGEEDLFPIDGQHRLAGIRKAVKSNPQVKEEIVSVLFVADRGDVETRRLFSTLNRYAVPVNRGERIILDEDDGMAITTRRLITDYPLFRKERVAPPKRQSLPESDQSSFTTAVTLYTINIILGTGLERGKQWKKNALTGSQRPDDIQLKRIFDVVAQFWDLMIKHFPSVKLVKGRSFKKAIVKNRKREGGHLLFRPVGQMAFARAIRMLRDRRVDMESAFERLHKLPSFELTDAPWEKVVWRNYPDGGGEMIATVKAQNLAAKLLLHLGGFTRTQNEQDILLEDYRKALENANAKLPTPI